MDDSSNCALKRIKNDNMAESDYYRVMSDSWDGKSRWAQRPAECWIAFNFGDRYVTVTMNEWRCRAEFQKPFLSIYDDCHGKRNELLVQLNCSIKVPLTIRSSGPCLSLYHYRGHTKWEIIAFPAGGIAAIIIASIVVIMVIVKIVCLVSGFERRLPKLNLNASEQKQIMDNAINSVVTIKEPLSPGSQAIKETILINVPDEKTVLRVTRSSLCSENNICPSSIDVDMYDIIDHNDTPPSSSQKVGARRSTQCTLTSPTLHEDLTALSMDRMLMPRASIGALQHGSASSLSKLGRCAGTRVNSIFGNH